MQEATITTTKIQYCMVGQEPSLHQLVETRCKQQLRREIQLLFLHDIVFLIKIIINFFQTVQRATLSTTPDCKLFFFKLPDIGFYFCSITAINFVFLVTYFAYYWTSFHLTHSSELELRYFKYTVNLSPRNTIKGNKSNYFYVKKAAWCIYTVIFHR